MVGRTAAPIKWPAHTRRGQILPVLIGDLVKAIVLETETAISNAFGVSRYYIDLWKRALTGETDACEVHAALALLRFDPAFCNKYDVSQL